MACDASLWSRDGIDRNGCPSSGLLILSRARSAASGGPQTPAKSGLGVLKIARGVLARVREMTLVKRRRVSRA